MSLDQKTREADRIYEDFEPPSDWDHEDASDTLIIMLPGFKKEQLRVQVTSTRLLRVSGERQINEKKWRRFRKEFPIPSHSNTRSITAKFESGILYIKLSKNIIQQNPPTPQEEPQKPTTTIPEKPNTSQVVEQEPKKDEQEYQRKGKGHAEEELKGDEKVACKRLGTMEMVARQRQEYMNALCGLVDEVKKQKKVVNLLMLVFSVLLFGLYVKNVIKSFFSGGHKNHEL